MDPPPSLLDVAVSREVSVEDSLWVIAADGSNPRRLVSLSSKGKLTDFRPLHYAVWDPSGRYIAYEDRPSLMIVDVDTAEKRPVPLPESFDSVSVLWWPDGTQIGVLSDVTNFELWTIENLLADERSASAEAR